MIVTFFLVHNLTQKTYNIEMGPYKMENKLAIWKIFFYFNFITLIMYISGSPPLWRGVTNDGPCCLISTMFESTCV